MKILNCYYDNRTCRNEALVEDLVQALKVAKKALRQYQAGKTWQYIASDALDEIDRIMEGETTATGVGND